MTNKEINQKLDAIINTLASMDARITALESSQTVSAKKSTSKKTTSSKKQSAPKQPTQAQLDARKAWGEAQHKRAEARKALFNVVESPEYKKEWEKWQKSKKYKDAPRAERKELNKAKHAEIVAKLSK